MRRLYWYDAVILRLVLDDFSRLLILQNFIGPTIRIGREIRCLPYAGFFKIVLQRNMSFDQRSPRHPEVGVS